MSAYIRKTDGVYMYVFGLPIWAPKNNNNVVDKKFFLPGTPVSSTNKTDHLDIAEILLKVALNTITLTL
jgi:hypothetical protein